MTTQEKDDMNNGMDKTAGLSDIKKLLAIHAIAAAGLGGLTGKLTYDHDGSLDRSGTFGSLAGAASAVPLSVRMSSKIPSWMPKSGKLFALAIPLLAGSSIGGTAGSLGGALFGSKRKPKRREMTWIERLLDMD